MSDTKPTAEFSGSIPELYDLHLVPMLFEAMHRI